MPLKSNGKRAMFTKVRFSCVRARMEMWNRVVREDFRCHRQMFRATAVAETTSFWSQSQPQPWLGTFDLWQRTLLDFRFGLGQKSATRLTCGSSQCAKRRFYHRNSKKCPLYEKGPTFDKIRSPCQEHSNDEHRILGQQMFFQKGSDPTFK